MIDFPISLKSFLNLAKVKEQQENFEQDEKKKKLYNWLKFIETDNSEERDVSRKL